MDHGSVFRKLRLLVTSIVFTICVFAAKAVIISLRGPEIHARTY